MHETLKMEEGKETAYLFDIIKVVKQFYETPVIFLTKKDYSEVLFESICYMLTALNDNSKNRLIDLIVDYHLHWLHAIQELENFKSKIHDIDREDVCDAICYTKEALGYRLQKYQKYMEKNKVDRPVIVQINMTSELEIIEDMHKEVTEVLTKTLQCFKNCSRDELYSKLNNEVEDLLTYIDNIYDGFSLLLSKYLNMNVPHLTGDLTKTLQQIVDDLQTSKKPTCQKILEELKSRGKEISSLIRGTAPRNLEIAKVVEKINILEEKIKRLQSEPAAASAAVMALIHKKEYLEQRLDELEQLKLTIKQLHGMSDGQLEGVAEEDLCICEDFFKLRIFNHSLPPEERDKLVTELCSLWDFAVFGERSRKSIISILSAAEVKEEFSDDLGTFFIDGHSRKIYKFSDDDTLYQPNELNQLVPLSDDADHIYYYDECGRYFLDHQTRQRIYKAHENASEYMMDTSGVLLKLKEERDGVIYYYDNYGRYYINAEGKHIYRDTDSNSEYENDGLGNLVRIRSHLDLFQPCPDDANVSDDFKYLKQTVGSALRESIADCILHQPSDPIKFLSTRLLKYRENMEFKEKHAREQEALKVERDIKIAEERAAAERAAMEAASLMQGGSEASYDSNLYKYKHEGDEGSIKASSK